MNVVICGASGMLGKDITELLSRHNQLKVLAICRKRLHNTTYSKLKVKHIYHDLNDHDYIRSRLDRFMPDVIINCAALVDVDACEFNRDYAYTLHVETTAFLAKTYPNAYFIYISSDSVFDGISGNYNENSHAEPLNYYSYTKWLGEKQVLVNSKHPIVLRTNIYGFHLNKANSLVEFGLKNFDLNQPIRGFTDVVFNPLYTGQLALLILQLIQNPIFGIIHASCDTSINKFCFLQQLATLFNYDTRLISPAYMSDFDFNALRPLNTTLNNQMLFNHLGYTPTLKMGFQWLKADYYKHQLSLLNTSIK